MFSLLSSFLHTHSPPRPAPPPPLSLFQTTFVKFHWKPAAGVKCLLDAEAEAVGGANHSHATQDLFEAIASGDYPEWTLFIQALDPAAIDRLDFDPLDVTKVWPEDVFPLQPVGRMVLNKNPDNFFAENEMLAFCPALIVPGIGYSDDKLLQTRIFSYADTQRYRLGPNYLLLPVNAPKGAPHHNNHHDGLMNFTARTEEVNYFPSRFDRARHAAPTPIPTAPLAGPRTRGIIPLENNFVQPGARWRSWDPARQGRFVDRLVGIVGDPRTTPEIRRIWVGYLSQCDAGLGERVAQALTARGAA